MNETDKVTMTEDIRAALRMIIDPEIGKNIIDLGLVYDIAVEEGGVVYVTMTTTTRFCPATEFLKEAVQACVWYVPGVEYAEVRLTYEPPWTPEMVLDVA
ncbi:metal-sulfur cluster assembly factor [Shinella sp. M31]|uniref:metal-sulfur cluster assembly factor n=1 Tax=Shinella sp. M31 TaxID=3368615 RepID=UPI0028D49CE5|nr:metal-sulfur cluster assembly factor [uncultured Shinella sp.]